MPTFGPSLRVFAIAGVLLFGNLATVFHAVAVRHVTCPEHGELVHLEVVSGGAEGQIGPTDEHGSLQDGPTTSGPRTHDHCGLCALGRDRLGRADQAPRAVVAAPISVRPELSVADERPARTAVYRFAPKTSPPLRFSSEECRTGAPPQRDGGERNPTPLG